MNIKTFPILPRREIFLPGSARRPEPEPSRAERLAFDDSGGEILLRVGFSVLFILIMNASNEMKGDNATPRQHVCGARLFFPLRRRLKNDVVVLRNDSITPRQ